MRKPRSTGSLLVLLFATSLPVVWLAWMVIVQPEPDSRGDRAVEIKLQVDGGKERVELRQDDDGTYTYVIRSGEAVQVFSPQELADHLYRQQISRGWLARLFNISSPVGFAWVGIGLLGQVLFTGRMVIQWLASEKSRQSVVPPMFWWMSLCGAMMLLTYFLWRRDIVGVLGQSFGLIIYIRNLYFIHAREMIAVARPAGDLVPMPGAASQMGVRSGEPEAGTDRSAGTHQPD